MVKPKDSGQEGNPITTRTTRSTIRATPLPPSAKPSLSPTKLGGKLNSTAEPEGAIDGGPDERDLEPIDEATNAYGEQLEQLELPMATFPGQPVLRSDLSKSTGKSLRSSSPPKSGRSSSPTKTMADLTLADPPIRYVEAGAFPIAGLPANVASLHRQFSNHAGGECTMPQSLRKTIMDHLKDVEFPREWHFDKQAGPSIEEDLRIWETVKEIRNSARSCNEDGDAESGWGEMVYSRLLYLSLSDSRYYDSVWFKNITQARIEPKTLLPTHVNGRQFASRMVDYAIVLRPDEIMRGAIRDVLKALDGEDCNINHTKYAPIRYNPIIANVEVKPPGSGKDAAMVQLAIWVAAQFNRLSRLGGGIALHMMPLIWVEGHDWRIYIAFRTEEMEVILYGGEPFGRTNSITGIYHIIKGIQLIADWGVNVYKPLFQKSILKLSPSASADDGGLQP